MAAHYPIAQTASTETILTSDAAILVLQRSDLAHIAAHAERFASARLLLVDPGLLDEAAVRGLSPLEFRPLTISPDFQALAATEAIARATSLDLRLTKEREKLWPGVNLNGWDVGGFFHAMVRLSVVRQLGEQVVSTFPERRIGLLRPTLAQQMYFDSFVGPDIVQAMDPGRFYIADIYDQIAQGGWSRAEAYGQSFEAEGLRSLMADGRISLVSHVPTCWYDLIWLHNQVSKAHPFTLDLPSPAWDTPLHRGEVPVRLLDDCEPDATAQIYRHRAHAVFADVLGDLLPQPCAREAQIATWAERCYWQAMNYLALRRGLAGSRPHFLLGDQDTGLNGPLFSVAHELGASITVVPHSGHPTMVLPHGHRVTAIEHAGYGTKTRTMLGQAVAMRAVRIHPEQPRREARPLQRICLLLNSMQTEGLSYIDARALAAFFRQLASTCESHGVALLVRPKPGAPALSVLVSVLGVPADQLIANVQQPLPELALTTDLCIAFGEPTTGVAAFMNAGSLVLQVSPQYWPTDYLISIPLIEDRVIPMLSHVDALAQLQLFMAEPARFLAACREQADEFERRKRLAHDHLF